jgi:hypothetical protein
MFPLLRLVIMLVCGFAAFIASAETTAKRPISKDGFFRAVRIGGLTSDEMITFIRELGVDFRLDPSDRDQLEQAGVDPKVVTALEQSYREPASEGKTEERLAELLVGAPLSVQDLIGLLRQGESSDLLEKVVDVRGISFTPTSELAKQIQQAGGQRGLLGVLMIKQPSLPPPPVLSAQVPQPKKAVEPKPPVPAQPGTQGPKAASDEPMVVPPTVQAARLLTKPAVNYPFAAKQARITGVVRFEAVIGVDGRVETLRPVSGHPLLLAGAERDVKQFAYVPARIDGKPARVKTEIEVAFRLP